LNGNKHSKGTFNIEIKHLKGNLQLEIKRPTYTVYSSKSNIQKVLFKLEIKKIQKIPVENKH